MCPCGETYSIKECPGTALETLCQTMMSGRSAHFFIFSPWLICIVRSLLADGLQVVYDGIISILGCNNLVPELKYRLLEPAVDILGKHPWDGKSLKLHHSIKIHPLLSNLLEKNIENYQKIVWQFLEFTDCEQKSSYFLVLESSVRSGYLMILGTNWDQGQLGFITKPKIT